MSLDAELNGGDDPPQGRVSLRQLRVLIEQLPPDSAVHRQARGHAWRDDTYLLALIGDAVRELTTVTAAAHSKNPRSVKRPEPLPRPVDRAVEEQKAREAEEVAERMRLMVGRLTPEFQHLF